MSGTSSCAYTSFPSSTVDGSPICTGGATISPSSPPSPAVTSGQIIYTETNPASSGAGTVLIGCTATTVEYDIDPYPFTTCVGDTTPLTTILPPTPSTTSRAPSSPPSITPKPTGPTYGVYIAFWTDIITINGQEGLPPNYVYEYRDYIWATTGSDAFATASDFCATGGAASAITLTKLPSQNIPYPTASITGLRPGGTSGPSCDWIPSPDGDGPGSLSCDASPTSVPCFEPLVPGTGCGVEVGEAVAVDPMVECVWQEVE